MCAHNFKEDLGFDDLEWLCGATRLPVVVKGVCRGDDAVRATEHGAKAIVVSNHGGRQLDTAPPTCEILPHVADAVGDRGEIYVDGGIRRGSDVLKAMALGARAVLVGRPILWGLCVNGEQGAIKILEILRRELDEAMLLCGCTNLSDIDRSLLARHVKRVRRIPFYFTRVEGKLAKSMRAEELRSLQAPLKQRYRQEPEAALVTLKAEGQLGEGVSLQSRDKQSDDRGGPASGNRWQ